MKHRRGLSDQEPFLGILSLDTAFERVIGDVGNPESYPFPARVRVVAGAGSREIVRDGRPDPDLVAAFVAAAQDLEAEGAAVIVSTCGFLVTVQDDLAAAVTVPVLLSALSLGTAVLGVTGGRPLAVLTASASALGNAALGAAGLAETQVRICGLDDCAAFHDTFLVHKAAQRRVLDIRAIEAEVVTRAVALVTEMPEVGAILLECGNLPPYAEAIRAATGRPVFHLLDGAALLWAASGNVS